MLCPHCNSSLEPNHKYCPHCGKSVNTELDEKKEFLSPRHGILWLAAICVAGLFLALYAWMQPGVLEEVVEKQLSAIKNKQITQAYYDYTGKDFQKETSLDEFREFVSNVSPIVNNKSIHFTERLIEGKFGLVSATLTSTDGEQTNVEYKLGKSKDTWKIVSLRLVVPENKEEQIALVTPIKNQLEELKSNNLKGAYEDLVNSDFKHTTPFELFRLFVQAYPVLKNYNSYAISQKTIHGNDADVSVILDTDSQAVTLRYKMAKEDNRWKIRSLEVVFPDEEADYAPIIEAMQNFLNDLRSKEIAHAYQDYTSKQFQDHTVLNAFEDFILSNPSLVNSSPIVIKVSLTDSIGVILGALLSKSGEAQPLEIQLIQEGGIWKILDIKLEKGGNY